MKAIVIRLPGYFSLDCFNLQSLGKAEDLTNHQEATRIHSKLNSKLYLAYNSQETPSSPKDIYIY